MVNKLAHSGSVLAAYRLLAPIVRRFPLPSGTVAESIAGRRAASARWEAWAGAHRGAGPLIWSHAASVGEQQVLEPVLHRLLRARPDARIVETHTSPSVVPTAVPPAVCHRDFLPWDEPAIVGRALDALRPSLLVFGRGDLWPELALAASRASIPIAVVGATVRPRSLRLRARRWLRPLHGAVSWLGAVSAADAERWARLGVPPERIEVTGDPRHDRLVERVPRLDAWRVLHAWAGGAPVFVAGSIEPPDDPALTDAVGRLRRAGVRTVLVPHDPTPTRVAAVRRRLEAAGHRADVWNGPGTPMPDADTVVVSACGLLADLYLAATVAYVGGGFRRGTLHAVAEPAAVGLPVIIGPRWEGAADAGPMVAAGGALPLPATAASTALAQLALRLAGDPGERSDRGLAARATLLAGASRVTADAILGLLRSPIADGR